MIFVILFVNVFDDEKYKLYLIFMFDVLYIIVFYLLLDKNYRQYLVRYINFIYIK